MMEIKGNTMLHNFLLALAADKKHIGTQGCMMNRLVKCESMEYGSF